MQTPDASSSSGIHRNSSPADPFAILDEKCLQNIFKYLPLLDLANLYQVSPFLNAATKDYVAEQYDTEFSTNPNNRAHIEPLLRAFGFHFKHVEVDMDDLAIDSAVVLKMLATYCTDVHFLLLKHFVLDLATVEKDASIEKFFTQMPQLILEACSLSNSGILFEAGATILHNLYLLDTTLDNATAVAMGKLTELRTVVVHLAYHGHPTAMEETFQKLVRNNTHLYSLELRCNETFQFPAIASTSLRSLKYTLIQQNVSGREIKMDLYETNLPSLEKLRVAKIGAAGIELDVRPLIDQLVGHQKLKRLNLYGSVGVDHNFVERLLAFPLLEQLTFSRSIDLDVFRRSIDLLDEMAGQNLQRLEVHVGDGLTIAEWMELFLDNDALDSLYVYVVDDHIGIHLLERVLMTNEFVAPYKFIIIHEHGFIWRKSE